MAGLDDVPKSEHVTQPMPTRSRAWGPGEVQRSLERIEDITTELKADLAKLREARLEPRVTRLERGALFFIGLIVTAAFGLVWATSTGVPLEAISDAIQLLRHALV